MKKLIPILLGAIVLASCATNQKETTAKPEDSKENSATTTEETKNVSDLVPAEGSALPYNVLVTLPNGTEIRNGGFGSSATACPDHNNMFYALTDRGPNAKYTGEAGKGKKFPVPDYTPRIGLFKVNDNGSVSMEKEITLKDPSGNPITGRPNPEGRGTTGEIPYDNDGNVLYYDDYGLDGEGIVALKNGEFWISDEYGPHIVHYNADGVELERISPVGVETGERKLPAVFKRRRANRGMEGLAITPDEKTLVGIMQSTLYNPSKKEVTNPTLTRIVTFNIETAETHQYLYRQNTKWLSNSEIRAITDKDFLVIERDGKFSGAEEAQKHIYKISLDGAYDVSGDFDSQEGLLINEKPLEQCSWEELETAGITPVKKELVVDVVKTAVNHYPHEKMEGIWIIDNNTLGILNDDDFAVSVKDGEVVQKILPGADVVDSNKLYIIKLETPLE
ncbi:MAG: esterase-like activity of phytase family protein [Spirochaetales bacterium]|nr:esterase-like activity of phytase family protein [Spirochaetales bacterium]